MLYRKKNIGQGETARVGEEGGGVLSSSKVRGVYVPMKTEDRKVCLHVSVSSSKLVLE